MMNDSKSIADKFAHALREGARLHGTTTRTEATVPEGRQAAAVTTDEASVTRPRDARTYHQSVKQKRVNTPARA